VGSGRSGGERDQHLVDDAPDQPQWTLRQNAVLKVHIGKQLTTPLIRSGIPASRSARTPELYSISPCQPVLSATY
jgi:hypothetical protein